MDAAAKACQDSIVLIRPGQKALGRPAEVFMERDVVPDEPTLMDKDAICEPGEEGEHYEQRTSTSLKFCRRWSTPFTEIKTTAIHLLDLRAGLKKQTHPNTAATVIGAVTEEVGIHMGGGGRGREEGDGRECLARPAAYTSIFRHDATRTEA